MKFNERIQNRGQGGFTLIELLVVIAILGILAGVVVFAVGNTTDNAQKNACVLERKTIVTAMEAYKANAGTGAYPAGPGWTDQLVGTGTNNFLQDDPTPRWTFQATPAGVLSGTDGIGKCAGF